MRTIRSNGVTAIVVFVGAISLGLGFAGPAGALLQPETTITDQPTDPSTSSSASFSFDSSVIGSTFECQLDGNGFSSCSSPQGYSNLSDGSHTFDVQATDPLFPPTTDPTPASYTWTVDTTGPTTTISSGPSGTTNQTSAHFEFSAPGAASYECSRDGGAFNPCTSPEDYTVGEGAHSFGVRAVDSLGNGGPTATDNWTVDTTGPTTSFSAGPSGTTNQTSVHFAFSAPGAASYECNRDGAGFNPCSSPQDYSVGEGAHTFDVRATDSVGNVGPVVSRSWTVDTTGPTTTITTGPSGTTNQTSVHFDFSAPGVASYECSRDGGSFNPCSPPQDYTVGEGSHTFAVRAIDGAGNTGPAASQSWTVDTTGPATSISSGPSGTVNQTSVHFDFSAPGAASYECSRDGAGFTACSPPQDYTVGEGAHSFDVRALDTLGNVGATTTRNWTVDTTGPTTTITSGPSGTTNQTSVHFDFSAPGAASYECSRDGGAFAPCNPPQDYTVAEGSHSFAVRAKDSVGNIGTGDSRTWNVVTTGPTTTITSGPSGTTNQTSVHFDFSAPGAASYECSRDGAAFSACTPPQDYTVGSGAHTFTVRAKDSLGNTGAPAGSSWTVDTTGPTVTISSGPSGTVTTGSASFTFSSTAGDLSRFECKVDAAPSFTACTSPANYAVGDGPHVFRVQGVDTVGNTGPVATQSWTVDASPPDVSITNAPSNPSALANASFSFTSTATDLAGFECKLDSANFGSCTSPQPYNGLSAGSHTFQVHAKDAAGNNSSNATYTWTVDTGPPDVPSITGGPSSPTNQTSASFTFSSAAPDVASYQCKIDSDPSFTTCSSPANYVGLGEGGHTFSVRAIDTAGNVGSAASRSWSVDTTPPTAVINSGPQPISNTTNALFSFSSNDQGAGFHCQLDGGGFQVCNGSSSQTYPGPLAQGSHTFQVRATDSLGNTGAVASFTWTVDTIGPDATITAGPVGTVGSPAASFEFSSSATDVTRFECKLDTSAFATCASPKGYPNLAEGAHTFSVRAVDSAGNFGAAATQSWTVDTQAPNTLLGAGGPSGPTNATTATFDFSSTEPGSTFECQLQPREPDFVGPCTSPVTYSGLTGGSYVFRVRAIDQLGHVDATPVSRSFSVDTTPPSTTLTQTPSDPTSDNTPTFGFSSPDSDLAGFECRFDADAFAGCTSPYTAPGPGLTNGRHTFEVRAKDAVGNVDPTAANFSFSVDTVAPDTLIDTGPNGPTRVTGAAPYSVTFTFHADKAASGIECQLTGTGLTGGYTACGGAVGAGQVVSKTYGSLQNGGNYTFYVRAIGQGGSGPDLTPDSRNFIIDATAPQTTITPPSPSGTLNSGTAAFTFTSSEANSTFECQLDSQPITSCSSGISYASLANGNHTFLVRAIDPAGNPDPTFANRSWTVDLNPPTITGPALTNAKRPTFSITTSAPLGGRTFECALDTVAPNPPAFAACGASYTPAADLVDGPHKISVRSRDANGNFSPVVTWAFQVDTVGPDLHLDATPALLTNNPDATFQFSVLNETPDTVITFECQIDPPPLFAPCTSPVTYPGLADNRHTFQVRATDPAGNVTTVPYTWTVDTSKPQTQIGSRPRPVTNATTATFDYQSPNASPATFQCRIDGTAYTDCTQQPKVYANLLPGQHTFEVKAINSAGNEDPDPASYVWSIDTADPDTTLGAAPPAVTTSGFATFTFASEAGASFECRLDGSAWTACPTPKIYGELALGQHTFAVRAVDEAGNRDNSPATRTWTVVPAPTPPATAASGPNLINPFPVIRIAGTITKRGVRLRLFLVNAPAGSKVSTRCRGKGCPFSKKSRAARALRLRTVEKKFYPAGVRIEVFVTKPGMIGKYTRFKVRKGKAPVRTDRCLPPGSLKPVRCS